MVSCLVKDGALLNLDESTMQMATPASLSPLQTPDDNKTLVASSSASDGLLLSSASEVNVHMTDSVSSRIALEVSEIYFNGFLPV